MKDLELEIGKIYFIQFGSQTQIVGRYKDELNTNYLFFDHLHYWNGYETFHKRGQQNYCVKSGIEEIREATLPEKHALIKFELEYNCI